MALEQKGLAVARFPAFWLESHRPHADPFDFFLLKILRFVEFVQCEAPDILPMAEREAVGLREAYDFADQLSGGSVIDNS